MVKLVALISAKPGLGLDEFATYYENHHVPLVRSLLPGLGDYRRSYVTWDPSRILRDAQRPDFDVLTEVWFEDSEAFEQFKRAFAEPEVAKRIEEDEAKFMDRESIRIFIVDERRTRS